MPNKDQQLLNWVPRLRRYARALCSNRDDADDLVQNTLERAWAKSTLWQGVVDMRAWLFGIMHHVHQDDYRRPQLQTVNDEDIALNRPISAAQDERLQVRDLQAALDQLPSEQREVLLMVALEEMPYADIARSLNVPMGTVMSRLSRGRERLRAVLAGQAPTASHLKVVK